MPYELLTGIIIITTGIGYQIVHDLVQVIAYLIGVEVFCK
jgi:hypothetical protein